MPDPLMQLVQTLITALGIPGIFVVFWIWERRRTQVVVDRHLKEQAELYDEWLQEQRELYERYLEDMREWASPRDRSRARYQPEQLHQPGGSEMRPFRTIESPAIGAPGD